MSIIPYIPRGVLKNRIEGCIINKIVLYTDAGCVEKNGRYGFLIRYQEKNAKQILGLGCIETTNSLLVELVAIKRALEYVIFHDLSQYEILLMCRKNGDYHKHKII